jgi:hypothetical protein
MKFIDPDIDHIDPRWKEGRDYQLVCGLDCALNYCERETKFNTAKSNRFLPWRYCPNEIGTIPVEQGDLCQFLVEGEWVLMEFLSEEWFDATTSTAGGARALIEWQKTNNEESLRHRSLGGRSNVENKTGWYKFTEEERAEVNSRAGKVGGKKVAAQRWMCTVTGKITNAGALIGYQRKRGIDPSNRIRLE